MPQKHELLTPDPVQDGLFGVVVDYVGNGSTEVRSYSATPVASFVEDGTAEEPVAVVTNVAEVAEPTVSAAAAQRSMVQQRVQRGLHSAFDSETGQYRTPRSGDVLPGYGIVYPTEIPYARAHVRYLNRRIIQNTTGQQSD